ncbi:MAG: hypothetical protein K9N47_01350 [Prosthecobacter sp.]|uniref:hypothetical protein n=1 Tax=Prosthecobacter sp. TaxID=1965333 RepID=UPI0026006DD6|nr:hypothetical protein [Prosthecobacter sp.]MCF7784732.1 hypothetical protein [Prosthecobacter sp.]
MMHLVYRIRAKILCGVFVLLVFPGCSRKHQYGVTNAACYFQSSEAEVLACDFDIHYEKVSSPDQITATVTGPILLGVDATRQDAAFGGLITVALSGTVKSLPKFSPGEIYLIGNDGYVDKVGTLKKPVTVELNGNWSGRACGWLVAGSLFSKHDGEFTDALDKALHRFRERMKTSK